MEVMARLRNTIGVLVTVSAALVMTGCGPKNEDFDANDIAVKQSGDGPPPMNAPMNGGTAPANQ